eukprot:1161887-Karenia_brevis.AAC.1
MGLCLASNIADAAYLASRAQTYEMCVGLDGRHVWDDGRLREGEGVEVLGEWLAGASQRYDQGVPVESRISGMCPSEVGKQG